MKKSELTAIIKEVIQEMDPHTLGRDDAREDANFPEENNSVEFRKYVRPALNKLMQVTKQLNFSRTEAEELVSGLYIIIDQVQAKGGVDPTDYQ